MKIFVAIFLFSTLVSFVSSQSFAFSKSFEIDGIKYYHSGALKKNWYQALRFCYQHGLYLVDFETEDELNKVLNYMRSHPDEIPMNRAIWTAGTSLGSDGEFYWATTGSIIKYNGFGGGQPDNNSGHEYCLELSDLKVFDWRWNDSDCDQVNYFICRQTRYFNLQPMTKK